MKLIEEWLRKTIGLDATVVGSGLIRRAARQRMKCLGLKRLEDYRRFVEHSHAEWHELVESVVVSETWFLRDPETIAAFVSLVRNQWLPARTTAPLRLLSMPCSSGEEPFSLAMALLDAGVPAQRFQIDAVDISTRALARAQRGIFGKNSFRGKHLVFRDRHFQPCGDGFALNATVRNCVCFSPGNFLIDYILAGQARYDFIFCRNLLIYLEPMMRRKALAKIDRLLTPDGILFVDPVEQQLAIEYGFLAVGIPLAFACCKPDHKKRRPPPAGLPPPARPADRPQLNGKLPPQLQPGGGPRLRSAAKPSASCRTDIESARRLVDAGRLQEAAEICEAHLRQCGLSAQAYYLLGLVRDAAGKPGAIECYRKALYLEPNHYESLLQMALLLQKNGDTARARAFKCRAQRLETKP